VKAAQKMARFSPKPDVLTVVSMTRPAYAQLAGQVFYPPKVFGVWQEQQESPEHRWRDIGMKIVGDVTIPFYRSLTYTFVQACGFEMMYAESKSQAKTLSSNSTESVGFLDLTLYPPKLTQ
jgi:hypothetical protein